MKTIQMLIFCAGIVGICCFGVSAQTVQQGGQVYTVPFLEGTGASEGNENDFSGVFGGLYSVS